MRFNDDEVLGYWLGQAERLLEIENNLSKMKSIRDGMCDDVLSTSETDASAIMAAVMTSSAIEMAISDENMDDCLADIESCSPDFVTAYKAAREGMYNEPSDESSLERIKALEEHESTNPQVNRLKGLVIAQRSNNRPKISELRHLVSRLKSSNSAVRSSQAALLATQGVTARSFGHADPGSLSVAHEKGKRSNTPVPPLDRRGPGC